MGARVLWTTQGFSVPCASKSPFHHSLVQVIHSRAAHPNFEAVDCDMAQRVKSFHEFPRDVARGRTSLFRPIFDRKTPALSDRELPPVPVGSARLSQAGENGHTV